jgi:hypothetical protein
MKAVIILHNMNFEDKKGTEYHGDQDYHQVPHTQASVTTNQESNKEFNAFLMCYHAL